MSVLLVIGAFNASADEQLDAVFEQHHLLVSSEVDAPIPLASIDRLRVVPGVTETIPVGYRPGRIGNQPVVLVVAPSDPAAQRSNNVSDGRVEVAMSRGLRTLTGLSAGGTGSVSIGGVLIPFVVGNDAASGQERFDRASYLVASSVSLAALGLTDLAQPTAVLVAISTANDAAAVKAVAADMPGIMVQDREQAREAMLTGLRSVLMTLPLVAVIAFLLAIVLIYTIVRAGTIAQRRSLLLLRSLGATGPSLTGLAVSSALIHGLLGALLGTLAARPVAEGLLTSVPASIRNSSAVVLAVRVSPWVVTIAVVAVLLVSAAAAYAALRPVLILAVEDHYRESPPLDRPRRRWLGLGIGVLSLAMGIAAIILIPQKAAVIGPLAMVVAWATLGAAVVPVLMRWMDGRLTGTTAGFLSRIDDRGGPNQLGSSALVISGAIALLVALGGAAVNLERSSMPTLAGMSDVDLMVQNVPSDDLPTLRDLPTSSVQTIAATPGVQAVRPMNMGYITLRGSRIVVQGVEPNSLLPVVREGTRSSGALEVGRVFVSTQIESDLGLTSGSTFTLPTQSGGERTFTVAGVVKSFLWPRGLLVMHVDDSRAMWGATSVSAVEVVADDPGEVAPRLTAGLKSSGTPRVVATGRQLADAAEKVVIDSSQLYRSLSAVGLFVAALVASSAIALDTTTKSREFGTVRALGGSGGTLTAMVGVRSGAIVASGTLVGIVFGLLLQGVFAKVTAATQGLPVVAQWTAEPIMSALGAGAVVIVIATLTSARRLRRMSVPELMGIQD
ncbi:MAG: ABC transporter permease [Dermatophilaceae bacterium]